MELEVYNEVREKGTLLITDDPLSKKWIWRVERARRNNSSFGIYAYHRPELGGTILTVYKCNHRVERPKKQPPEYVQYLDGKTYTLQKERPYRFYRSMHAWCSMRGYKVYATWNTAEGWIEFVIDTGVRRRL